MIFSGTGPSFSTEGYIFFSCLIDIQTNEERYNFPFMSLPLCERLALVSVVWLLLIVFSFLCCGLCVCVILFFVVFVLCLEPNADCVSRFSILGCVLWLEPNADCLSIFHSGLRIVSWAQCWLCLSIFHSGLPPSVVSNVYYMYVIAVNTFHNLPKLLHTKCKR